MVAELNTSAMNVPAAYMVAVQQYVPTSEFAQHYKHLQQQLQMRQIELQQWVQHLQQQQQQQLTPTSQFYSVSSVSSDECDDAAITAASSAATYNACIEGTALYAGSNNMFDDSTTFGASSGSVHALWSDTTAAAAAPDACTAFTAADDIDDAWSTTIDPVLQSLWGTSQHEQQHTDNAASDSSDCCNSMLNEPLADDTPATFADVDMMSDSADCIDSMHSAVTNNNGCNMSSTFVGLLPGFDTPLKASIANNTNSSSSSSSSSSSNAVPLLKLVQWTDAVNTNRSSKADATDTHNSATAGIAAVGTDAHRSGLEAYNNELTMPPPHHNTATAKAQAHSDSSTATATTTATDSDSTADMHSTSVYANINNASESLSTIGLHTSGKATLLHTCDDTGNSKSSAHYNASSSISTDDLMLDNELTRALTLLKLKSQAGYYTESFRSQQAITQIQKWNPIRHGEVSMKLALLAFWCKSGHIDEQFRAEQAKLAWDSYTYSKYI
jgi:trimeric autotransporter adhesin